jgi:hypothetical protein
VPAVLRILKTGTGPGDVVGKGTVTYYAARERTINSCSVAWEGEDGVDACLPGLAFDHYLGNLREVAGEFEGHQGSLLGEGAKLWALSRFEEWLTDAREALKRDGALPLYESLQRVVDEEAGAAVVAKSRLVVRVNRKHARLWLERDIKPGDADDIVFRIEPRILWDWAVSTPGVVGPSDLLDRLEAQVAYYDKHGPPSSFRLRELGMAPFAAWAAAALGSD